MAYELPTVIVLQSYAKNQEHLGFIHNENNELHRYVEFSEIGVLSPYARLEVEPASGAGANDGLVHIRNNENNKFWVRSKNFSITENPAVQHWITATADKPEEDQWKETCTLFKFISVSSAKNMVRIMHVQSGCYLCLWELPRKHLVLANYKVSDHQSCDIFIVINLEPLILPKYIALKGVYNGKYICPRWVDELPCLQFAGDEIGDPTITCEIFYTDDGNIHIKSISSGKFWMPINSDWILADSDTGDALFRPVKIDDRRIALVNVANNNYCKRYTHYGMGKESCLSAVVPYINDGENELTVEEPVMKREIHDVKYKLDYTIFSDKVDLVVATNSVSNNSQQAIILDVKLSYADTKISIWDTNDLSQKSRVKASFIDIELPFMFMGRLKLSSKVQQEVEWGETKTSNTVVEVVHKVVVVPPMTKVTVDLYASYAKYEVPCSFTQKDTLYNGFIVTTEVQQASYTGSNYYNFNFETKEEKLMSTQLGC